MQGFVSLLEICFAEVLSALKYEKFARLYPASECRIKARFMDQEVRSGSADFAIYVFFSMVFHRNTICLPYDRQVLKTDTFLFLVLSVYLQGSPVPSIHQKDPDDS